MIHHQKKYWWICTIELFMRWFFKQEHAWLAAKPCPNVFTTQFWQWGFRQCLPLSWTTLRGKHCWHSIAVMGVQICSGHVNNLFRLQTPIILYPLIWHVMFLAFSHVALFVWNTKYKLIQYNSFNCWCCVFPPPNLSFPISLH